MRITCPRDAAIWQHHSERAHVVPHCAVPNRCRAAGPAQAGSRQAAQDGWVEERRGAWAAHGAVLQAAIMQFSTPKSATVSRRPACLLACPSARSTIMPAGGSPGCRHAAQSGIGSRVDWEEQPGVLEVNKGSIHKGADKGTIQCPKSWHFSCLRGASRVSSTAGQPASPTGAPLATCTSPPPAPPAGSACRGETPSRLDRAPAHPQVLVQLLARHPRLHPAVHVLRVDLHGPHTQLAGVYKPAARL